MCMYIYISSYIDAIYYIVCTGTILFTLSDNPVKKEINDQGR